MSISRMKPMTHAIRHQQQRGIVLFLSLVLLLLITVLGLGSMQNTSLQEKMVAGTRDRMAAFESAEASLNRARIFINSTMTGSETNGFAADGAGGLYSDAAVWDASIWKNDTATWVDAKTVKLTDAVKHTAGYPRYYIRHVGDFDPPSTGNNFNVENYQMTQAPKKISYYTVIARGVGLAPNTFVYLEGNFGRQF